MIYSNVLENVGKTPIVKLNIEGCDNIDLYAKLEFYNPTGSVKDRAASYILKTLLNNGEIKRDTTIIESSSGNFGVALSAYCKEYGLKFCCVVDPHISPVNENLIRSMGADVIKVNKLDKNGGFLLTRIEVVKELLLKNKNSYWINQYGNPYNAGAYYHTLGNEICDEINDFDYIFMGVSSGGTITGVSQKVKERLPKAKVIAVDIVGSVIFGGKPEKRYIPGIGSGMVPNILKYAQIDDVVVMDEITTIKACHELLNKHSLFTGGSTGSVYASIKQYFENRMDSSKKTKVVMICPDKGDRYSNTIYNEEWYTKFFEKYAEYKLLTKIG